MTEQEILSKVKNTQKQRAYTAIKTAIFENRFAADQMLREEELAQWLGISRTPLREALSALDREGLIKIVPHRGAFIRDITHEEILPIFDVREVLEGLAARLATPHIPTADLESLYEKTRGCIIEGSVDVEKLTEVDVQLHRLLFEYSGNETLQRFQKDISDRVQRFRIRSQVVIDRLPKSIDEHLRIIESILERNPEKAEFLIKRHIRYAKENTLVALHIPMTSI